jgi:carboxypeptidase Q
MFLLAASCLTWPADSPVDRVMAESLKPSPLQENVRALSQEIGGRVPGTVAMEKAIQWAEKAMRAAGADSVRLEEFTMPVSWQEGNTRVEVSAPEKLTVQAVSVPWAPATKGPIRARVVDVGEGKPADVSRVGNISGAILLVHTKVLETWGDLFNEYLNSPPVINAAVQGKAAAVAFISTREGSLLYRHIKNLQGEVEALPMLLVARDDGQRIAKLLAAGSKVEMTLAIPNKVGGPFRTHNVVGEIRGSERPEEFVVLGAHLDSWDLGQGALDDGCNSALVIDALRAIRASGVRPRRSIRFVLFSGEEQGMQGSLAYVRQHREELDRTAAVIIFDEGSGPVTGFSLGGRKDIVPQMTRYVEPFAQWNATKVTTDAFVGTDNFDFLLEGVPTLVASQQEANYMLNYHASSDTYDKVDFSNLKKHVAMAAALAFQIADAPERLGPRQTRAQVQRLLEETGVREQLKTFDLWQQWESRARGRNQ